MVATRSGRTSAPPAVDSLIADGQVEVKGTRTRRVGKSAIKEPAVVAEPQSPRSEGPNLSDAQEPSSQEAFKVVTAVKFSPRSPKTAAPSSHASSPYVRSELASPATTGGDVIGTTKRRLSMMEVNDAAQVPLPGDLKYNTDDEPVITKPRLGRKKKGSWVTTSICVVVAAVLAAAGAYTLLCHQPFGPGTLPPHILTAAEPHCTSAALQFNSATDRLASQALLLRTQLSTTTQSSVRAVQGHWASAQAQTKAQWAAAQAQAKSSYVQAGQWLSTQHEAVLSSQLGTKLFKLSQEVRAAAEGLLARAPAPTPFSAVLPEDALRAIVLQGHGLADVHEIYHQAHPTAAAKGTTLAIACGSACDAIHLALTSALALPEHTTLVDGSHFTSTESAGALQQQLASFLSASPTGVVVVTRLGEMDVAALVVLCNALAEGGSLQLGGKTVASTRALYLALVPTKVVQGWAADEVESKVKAELQQLVAGKVAGAGQDMAALALALRRRFDYVLPAAAAVVPAEEVVVPEAAAVVEEPTGLIEESDGTPVQEVVTEEAVVQAEAAAVEV